MRALVLPLALLCSGCAMLQTNQDDIWAVRAAVQQLDKAIEQSDAMHEKSLVQMRDRLYELDAERIAQAVLADLAEASKDGLTVEEVSAINAKADALRAQGRKSIQAAFDAGRDPKSRRDMREVYAALRTWILTRMDAEALKLEVIHEVEGLVGQNFITGDE